MTNSSFPNIRSPINAAVLLVSLLCGLITLDGGLNQALFLSINGLNTFTHDLLWASLTLLGDTRVLLASLLLFFLRHRHIAWAYMLVLIPGSIVVQGLKRALSLDRPLTVLDPSLFHVIGEPLKHHSFPSGHTAAVIALAAIVVSSNLPGSLRISLLLIALVTSLSRIMVGAHWPMDLVAGILLGYGIGLIGILMYCYFDKITRSARGVKCLWFILVVLSGSIFFQEDTDYPMVEWLGFAWVGGCLLVGILFFPRAGQTLPTSEEDNDAY